MQQQASSVLAENSYTYDAAGNILKWTQQNSADGTGTWNVTYDSDQELQKVVSQVSKSSGGLNLGHSSYEFDHAGNLTNFITNGSSEALASAAYQPNALNQLTSVTGKSYSGTLSYDANGNPANGIGVPSANPTTVADARTYTYDGANRLAQIAYGSGGANTSTLSYDGLSRLVEVVETVNGATQSDQRYVWIGQTMVEQLNAQGSTVKAYFDQGFLVGTTPYYYGKDHLGSIRNLTDNTATVQAQLDYGANGELTELTGQVQPDFAYTGFFYHQRSGLYFAEYRTYDSGLKRWLNRDPILENGGLNLYRYVSNNPLKFIDPKGTCGSNDNDRPLSNIIALPIPGADPNDRPLSNIIDLPIPGFVPLQGESEPMPGSQPDPLGPLHGLGQQQSLLGPTPGLSQSWLSNGAGNSGLFN
jgi:RHS repeat-associated protein